MNSPAAASASMVLFSYTVLDKLTVIETLLILSPSILAGITSTGKLLT